MHFVVSWDIQSKGASTEEIDKTMMAGLHGYSWLRLLSTFYVLEVDSEHDWYEIQKRLLSIAQHYSGEVNFLMSPLYEFDSDYFVYKMPETGFFKT